MSPNSESSSKRTAIGGSVYERISIMLLAAFPSSKDLGMIARTSGANLAYYILQSLTKPLAHFRDAQFETMAQLTVQQPPSTHPILIARQMLRMAIVLLHTDHNSLAGLSEPPQILMKRLADTAIDLVAKNNMIVGTAEGIECLMLQSAYEEQCGNLQQCWIVCRHAIAIAQALGLHCQSPPPLPSIQTESTVDARFLWYRLVYLDRFLSLIKGFPQAVPEALPISKYGMDFEEPMDELDYIHAAVSNRILKRNERGPTSGDPALTRDLEIELQRAASRLPSKWWLVPNLANANSEIQIYWEIIKIRSQIYHYNILNQLHLPFMLSLSSRSDYARYDYSRSTCVSASRDLLTRYNLCRAFNGTKSSCIIVDFFALWSAMTLLFAHIDSHRAYNRVENIFGHQRLSDRAVVEQTLESIGMPSHTNDDLVKAKCIKFLEKMLAIEDDASQGLSLRLVIGAEPSGVGECILRIGIPYVGVITITEDIQPNYKRGPCQQDLPCCALTDSLESDSLSKATSTSLKQARETLVGEPGLSPPIQGHKYIQNASPTCMQDWTRLESQGSKGIQKYKVDFPESIVEAAELDQSRLGTSEETRTTLNSALLLCPDSMTETEQWAYQGVELDFFDSLMRGTNQPISDGCVDWSTWTSSTSN
jgi:hypothetical protein